MGINLGTILKVGLPIFGGPWGAVASGLLSASDAAKQSSQGRGQQQQAANAYAQWLQQSQAAQKQIDALMPTLATQAGLNYTPADATTGAGPSFSRRTPGDFTQDPYYQNAYNSFYTPLHHQAVEQGAQIAAGQQAGVHQKGYAQNLLDQNVAEQEAQFNRDYMTNDRSRQDQFLSQLEGLLYGQQSIGAGAAAGLAGIGGQNLALGAAQTAPLQAALGQILTPQPKVPALPQVPTPGQGTAGTDTNPQTLPPVGSTGNTDTEGNTTPVTSTPDMTPNTQDMSTESSLYRQAAPPPNSANGPVLGGGVSDATTTLRSLIQRHTDPIFSRHAQAIHTAIQGMFS